MVDKTNSVTATASKQFKDRQDQIFRGKKHPDHYDEPHDSDADSGFSNDDESDWSDFSDHTESESEEVLSQRREKDMERLARFIADNLEEVPKEQRKAWVLEKTKEVFDETLPESLLDITAARFFEGDTGIDVNARPHWLDMDKLRRGQKFALDHLSSLAYADVVSLFALYSFYEDLKSIIATGQSSTPYASFKRFLSTCARVHNWYKSDPWTPGTPANKDIKAVRNLHKLVRKRMASMSAEEFKERSSIKEPWCVALATSRRDLQSSCPAPKVGKCPFAFVNKYKTLTGRFLSQGEMVGTQFGFVGLIVLRPEVFGIHYATDDDLEGFLHLWRSIGYQLGLDDNYNFCRGSLEDVRTRSREFLEFWVKPNLRSVTPEWEHMMRCVFQGVKYYYPGASYEIALLDFAEIIGIKMPGLYQSISYSLWITRCVMRLYLSYGLRYDIFRVRFNNFLEMRIERAMRFDEKKHEELQRRSAETLMSCATNKRE
ncbi:uncharacterized protein LOC106636827 [Copidosoma floridanum]|uniref:uncharacterized protein LOC106636827 n=1 Tax=Copidosoma floridanum TaxID=29053 RepID=UPI0006C98DF5|nr:uncharacterized protein LOC106636827 [Copidosoma floridanum]XP_023247853.1 uncharacterized protein LOC106636827 [Copidosoma floridanum]XP_023247854.1 uncharacterized protein LOC106636827 [Copidosoma floridanum]